MRTRANVLVAGTPGVGKSTICTRVMEMAEAKGLKHLNIAEMIKKKRLYREWDDERNCSIYDQEMVKGELEKLDLKEGGYLIEFHSVECLDPEVVDHVIVLRTDIGELGRRLEARGYSEEKIRENIECEIFQVVYEEAMEMFGRKKVMEFGCDRLQEVDEVAKVVAGLLTARESQGKRRESEKNPLG